MWHASGGALRSALKVWVAQLDTAVFNQLTIWLVVKQFVHGLHSGLFFLSPSWGFIWNNILICFSLEVFEEPEDPSSRSFFSEIISSISDVKFSHSGRYMMTRDYLSVKVWDLNMENRPVETYQVHRHLYTVTFKCNCSSDNLEELSLMQYVSYISWKVLNGLYRLHVIVFPKEYNNVWCVAV